MFSITDDAIYVARLNLWLDSMRERERSYVSHGHADHARPHARILTTPVNAAICEARFGRRGARTPEKAAPIFETHAFNEPWTLDDHELTLFPAGHVLGSAQLLIEGDAGRFVYTGDFKLERAFTAEPTEVKRCDTVLMECTYGNARYVFPPRAEIAGAMVAFAREALELDAVPIFFAYSLGKAQEAMAILGHGGIPLTVHGAVHAMSEVYQAQGMPLPPYAKYDADTFDGTSAIVWPPAGRSLPKAVAGRRVRTASLTGWSLGGGNYSPRDDRNFPLSDHADFPSLLRYIELAQPKKVLLNHGSKEFTRELRRRGVNAEYLEQNTQMSMF